MIKSAATTTPALIPPIWPPDRPESESASACAVADEEAASASAPAVFEGIDVRVERDDEELLLAVAEPDVVVGTLEDCVAVFMLVLLTQHWISLPPIHGHGFVSPQEGFVSIQASMDAYLI